MLLKRDLIVLYGSQTGTAQDLAERVGREAHRYRFNTRVLEMDDFDVCQLPEQHLVVFVCSTTGQGEEPDNMKKFWRFLLRRDLPTNSLSTMRFGVMGLGDSSYQKFNFAAKKLHKRLIQLGATPILQQPALGDEQHDMGQDAAVNPWLDDFWNRILNIFPLPVGVQPLSADYLPPPKYSAVKKDPSDPILVDNQPMKTGEKFDAKNPYLAKVTENLRVTAADHFQDVRLVSLDVKDSGIVYSPGDVVMVQPSNSEEQVDKFFQVFTQLDRHQHLTLTPNQTETKLPPDWILPSSSSGFTLEDCVRRYWDIQSIPRRSFFELLVRFSVDELEKEKLMEFISPEGQQDLYNYCNRPRRSLIEVLHDFNQTASLIPLDYLFDLIPSIKPRAFSIASSMKTNQDQLQILVAVVEYKTKLSEPRKGLCSTWLSRLQVGQQIPIWVRPGTFKFPTDPKTPVVMVGPGTGCSPFRSYIDQERCRPLGQGERQLVLFFGCRSRDRDFFFAQEWLQLKEQGRLDLFCAFSRDQPDKIYVQHRMDEQRSTLRRLFIDHRACLFIAGNSKQMPDQVTDALRMALMDGSDDGEVWTRERADAYITSMAKDNRLQLETWS